MAKDVKDLIPPQRGGERWIKVKRDRAAKQHDSRERKLPHKKGKKKK